MLTLPNLQANLDALAQLRAISFVGRIAATVRFPDEVTVYKMQAPALFLIFTLKRERVLPIMLKHNLRIYNVPVLISKQGYRLRTRFDPSQISCSIVQRALV